MREQKVIKLINRLINEEELISLAPFEVIWPQNLPEGYQLSYIFEMSESPSESTGSGIFVFEYINVNDQNKPLSEQGRLYIWEGASHPNLANKDRVGSIKIDENNVPLYKSDVGSIFRGFLTINGVEVEIEYFNLPIVDVERIASALAVN